MFDPVLEESRQAVHDTERDHDCHLHPNAAHRTQLGRPERLTDGDVAVERDEHGDPDSAELCGVHQRPHQHLYVRADRDVEVVVHHHGAVDLREAGGQQEEVVDERHHLQQEGRHVAVLLPLQHQKRQSVADQPEHTYRPEHDDVHHKQVPLAVQLGILTGRRDVCDIVRRHRRVA